MENNSKAEQLDFLIQKQNYGWTDSSNSVLQPPTVGSFKGPIGKFYCKDVFEGQEIIVEFLWDKTDVKNPIWTKFLKE